MVRLLKRAGRCVKQFMEKKIKICEGILSNAQNRLVLGFIILGTGVGLGGGLIVSAYIRVSE